MVVIALVSAKGSPGVTVSCLALALTWPRSVLVAECDPAGGDILAGYLAGRVPAGRGVSTMAVAERHGRLFEDVGQNLVDLGADRHGSQRWLLPGITDPVQAANLGPVWQRLSGYFAALEAATPPMDVIVDGGRLASAHPPTELLAGADLVVLTIRPTMTSISSAMAGAAQLRLGLADRGEAGGPLWLMIIGAGGSRAYGCGEAGRQLGLPVVAELPWDARTAAMLSSGLGTPHASATLLRGARTAQDSLWRAVAGRRARCQTPPPSAAGTLRTSEATNVHQ